MASKMGGMDPSKMGGLGGLGGMEENQFGSQKSIWWYGRTKSLYGGFVAKITTAVNLARPLTDKPKGQPRTAKRITLLCQWWLDNG